MIFIFYTMITKFICRENYNSIEFKKECNTLLVTSKHLVKSDTLEDLHINSILDISQKYNIR